MTDLTESIWTDLPASFQSFTKVRAKPIWRHEVIRPVWNPQKCPLKKKKEKKRHKTNKIQTTLHSSCVRRANTAVMSETKRRVLGCDRKHNRQVVVVIKRTINHSQSPAVVLRERRGKTAGWTTKQCRSDRSTTELCHRKNHWHNHHLKVF